MADSDNGMGTAIHFQNAYRQMQERMQQFKFKLAEFTGAIESSRRRAQEISLSLQTPVHTSLPPSMSFTRVASKKAPAKRCPLTKRESEVVRLVSLGCTTTEIGLILGIAESTADNAKTRAVKRLKVGKAALLTRMALLYGITSPADCLTPEEKRKCGLNEDGWN